MFTSNLEILMYDLFKKIKLFLVVCADKVFFFVLFKVSFSILKWFSSSYVLGIKYFPMH